MDNHVIAIQKGLNEIMDMLKAEGYKVVIYEEHKGDADIIIISGVDSEYEEIETAQCRLSKDDKKILLINATNIKPESVLKYIKTMKC